MRVTSIKSIDRFVKNNNILRNLKIKIKRSEIIRGFHTHLKSNNFIRINKNFYDTVNCEKNVDEALNKINMILNENNFYMYIKNKEDNTEDNLTIKKAENDVENFKLLNMLNKILVIIEKNDDLKIKIWKNTIFLDFLAYLKIKISIFNFHEMFLFVLCFSKIQFIPQILLDEILDVIKEKTYLNNFFRDDRNKFFQFLLILSNIKNIKSNIVDSNFFTFINNYIKITLDHIKKQEVCSGGEDICEKSVNKEKSILEAKDNYLTLDCYMLICTSLHNFNIINLVLFYEISNKIIKIVDEQIIKGEQVEMAKKLVNIYLSYCSLGVDNYYFYYKLNSFLYNVIDYLPLSNCVTLLLCISTLKEQINFNFPLCLLSIMEKNFINKFYSLDDNDLLLLIYLFTYLNLYIPHYESYICMFDYLFNSRNFNLLNEDDKLKLFQIYITLTQNNVNKVEVLKDNFNNTSKIENNESLLVEKQNKRNINELIVEKLDNIGIINKILKKIELNYEQNSLELNSDINYHIDEIYSLLNNEFNNSIFKVRKIKKNEILYNYYLNHIYLMIQYTNNSEKEHQFVINFDTDALNAFSNSIDIYTNMKKKHINNLNIKYIPIKLCLWKNLTFEEKKKFLTHEIMNNL